MDSLRKFRKAKKLSLRDAGKLVGVTGASWENWEKDYCAPSVRNIQEISRVTHIKIEELFKEAALIGSPRA